LTRHRKNLHGYQPRARRNFRGKAARLFAAAPYPSTQYKEDISASLDMNPMFPELAGLVPCDALLPAESSHSGIPQFQDNFSELTWEKLFPDCPSEIFASVYEQPSRLTIPTPNFLQPSTVPVDFSTPYMPQIDPKLLFDVNSQQPIPASNADFQCKPVSGNDPNNFQSAGLEEFLLTYGSGSFEGRCEYPDNATGFKSQHSFTNEYNF
jgi:hypothetical protein